MKRFDFRRAMLRRTPLGIAGSPFEFAVAFGWAVSSSYILVGLWTGDGDRQLRAFLPFTDFQLGAWAVTLFSGAVLIMAGLAGAEHNPLVWLNAERSGLILIAVSIATFAYAIVAKASMFSITLVSTAATLAAIVFRIVAIGAAVDVLRHRRRENNEGGDVL